MKLRNDLRDKVFIAALKNAGDWRRGHLGASAIGEECIRKSWYNYRWFADPRFSGRVLLLFRRGNKEEELWEDDFNAVDDFTFLPTAKDGSQFSFSEINGHYGGSIDGALFVHDADGELYLIELKTYNKARFASLEKNGVEVSDPGYYIQLQNYLGFSQKKRALFWARCKDNDHIHCEEVEADPDVFAESKEKAEYIIYTRTPPQKISNNSSYYLCGWCTHKNLCHKSAPVEETNCRTCTYGDPSKGKIHGEGGEGKWVCSKRVRKGFMSVETQKISCTEHRSILNIA